MRHKTEKIIHWIIIITTLWAVGDSVFGIPDVPNSGGAASFKYFTTDSNILACIASVLCTAYDTGDKRPHAVTVFRFACTAAVSITLLTVVLFLAPTAALKEGNFYPALSFFKGNVFVLHFSTPVLSVIALLLSGDGTRLKRAESLWALLPVMIYSLVYLFMVVIVRAWNDWYGFTFGGNFALAPVVLLVMYSFTAMLALLEWKLSRLCA